MKLIEPINGAVEKKIRTALLPTEDPLIQVSTDMDHNGAYGRVWLVATSNRVLVIPEGGSDSTEIVAIEGIERIRNETLVGGHRLEIERNEKPAICLLYSRSLGEKFAEVCRGIEQLRTGRPCVSMPNWTESAAKNAASYYPYAEASARRALRVWQPCAAYHDISNLTGPTGFFSPSPQS